MTVRKFAYYFLSLVLFLVIMWGVGFFWFISSIPKYSDNDTTPTDAIIVLTGGKGRLLAGMQLLEQGWGKKLLISGVGEKSTIEDLQKLSAEISPSQLKLLKHRIMLGHMAYSTQTNAIEAAIWMEFEQYKSLRLVTANYHIPRSIAQFQMEMPHIKIIAHPVFPDQFKLNKWWNFPGSAKLLCSEYHKFLAVRLAILLHLHVAPIPKSAIL